MAEGRMTLKEAVGILGLPERSNFLEVRQRYRKLLLEWHPDHCDTEREVCKEKVRRIVDAFQVVEPYCFQYPISFSEEDLKAGEAAGDTRAFWNRHFGEDPIWG